MARGSPEGDDGVLAELEEENPGSPMTEALNDAWECILRVMDSEGAEILA